MSQPKPCPVCGQAAHKFMGYEYGKVGCRNEECNYRNRPQYLDDWNNRPYENKIKADAAERALEELLVECNSFWSGDTGDIVICYDNIKEVMGIIINKLKRGDV